MYSVNRLQTPMFMVKSHKMRKKTQKSIDMENPNMQNQPTQRRKYTKLQLIFLYIDWAFRNGPWQANLFDM